ncbi:hypothetical protein BGX38DRAFT_1270437 [Terfezia claveryi]|nr:hypothetical protein BGX38DRAFT_1270437 [Terfezia claveryi]
MCFLNLTAYETDHDIVLTDGAVEGEGRQQLANSFKAACDEMVKYQDSVVNYECKLEERRGQPLFLRKERTYPKDGKKQGKELDIEEKWKAWAEKEVQVRAGKVVAAERKKWQAKGKALSVETVSVATQSDQAAVEAEKIQSSTSNYQKKGARPAAKAGKKSRPAKTPPSTSPPRDTGSVKAIAVHGVPVRDPWQILYRM